MKISDKLAGLNAARFAEWQPDFSRLPTPARRCWPQGDVYTGLAVEDFSEADLDFAQAHLRMLSGLYGVLRPLDLMMPYRLEMGIRLDNPRGKDLYQFWGDIITEHLNKALAAQGTTCIDQPRLRRVFSSRCARKPCRGASSPRSSRTRRTASSRSSASTPRRPAV